MVDRGRCGKEEGGRGAEEADARSPQERESNPLNRIQDSVTDQLEPLQKETKKNVVKLQSNIPDIRSAIPSTLPKVRPCPTCLLRGSARLRASPPCLGRALPTIRPRFVESTRLHYIPHLHPRLCNVSRMPSTTRALPL